MNPCANPPRKENIIMRMRDTWTGKVATARIDVAFALIFGDDDEPWQPCEVVERFELIEASASERRALERAAMLPSRPITRRAAMRRCMRAIRGCGKQRGTARRAA